MGICPLGGTTLGMPSVRINSVERRPALALDDVLVSFSFNKSIPTLRPSQRFVEPVGVSFSKASRTAFFPVSCIFVNLATIFGATIRKWWEEKRAKLTHLSFVA